MDGTRASVHPFSLSVVRASQRDGGDDKWDCGGVEEYGVKLLIFIPYSFCLERGKMFKQKPMNKDVTATDLLEKNN